ncbi:hypothetical protein FRC08_012509 [Ceratobasidium sp. 394]|nr:hypothetical protein FRC08_012509 [Ceratobasidium sp. 394]KAG9096801.1 hypothetical protein FS749_007694 [Ceratobasidium sp. UAMH 11750]
MASITSVTATVYFDGSNNLAAIDGPKTFTVSANKTKTVTGTTFIYNGSTGIPSNGNFYVRSAGGKTVINIGSSDYDSSVVVVIDNFVTGTANPDKGQGNWS